MSTSLYGNMRLPDRQSVIPSNLIEPDFHGGLDEGWKGRVCAYALDAVQVVAGGAAAVVADPKEAQPGPVRLPQLGRTAPDMNFRTFAPGAVFIRQAVSQNPRTVSRFPPEQARGQAFFVRHRPHEDIIVQAAFLKQLRQHGVVAEAVDGIPDPGNPAELLHEIALSVKGLANE
jgi:hypothetical protein